MSTWTRGGVQYKAAAYKEELHPRDKNGRFIHIGGRVRISPIAGGGEGTVRANAGGGKIDVERDDGSHVRVGKGYLEVLGPHPGGPGGAAPTAPDPAAAHLAEHGVPTVHVPQLEVPPLAPVHAPPPPPTPRVQGAHAGPQDAAAAASDAEWEAGATARAAGGGKHAATRVRVKGDGPGRTYRVTYSDGSKGWLAERDTPGGRHTAYGKYRAATEADVAKTTPGPPARREAGAAAAVPAGTPPLPAPDERAALADNGKPAEAGSGATAISDAPSAWPGAKTGTEALAAPTLSSHSDLPEEGLAGIPAEQIYQTLADYMAQAYSDLNGDLRVQRGVSKNIRSPAAKKHIRAIDALMKASPLTSDVVVYRGVRNPAAVLGPAWNDDNVAGAAWVDHAYVSTSTSPDIASRFTSKNAVVMRLHLPEGSRAIMLSQGIGEGEILTDRGLTYTVTKDRKVGDVRLLDVEVTSGKARSAGPAGAPKNPRPAPEQTRADAGVQAAMRAKGAFSYSHGFGGAKHDTVLEAIAHAQGLDAPPAVVPRAEVDAAIAAGSDELLRAVRSAADDEAFRSGPYYAGLGTQGNGIYVHWRPPGFDAAREARVDYYGPEAAGMTPEQIAAAHGEDVARVERRIAKDAAKIEARFAGITATYGDHASRMALKPGTPVLDYEKDVLPAQRKYLEQLRAELPGLTPEARAGQELWIKAMEDPGRYAAAHGIAAYRGRVPGEMVVVDRGALLVEEKGAAVERKWRRGGVEYKATRFEEIEHPRDARGRFITIGAHVRISPIIGGGEGTVRGTEHGLITVDREDGRRVNVARGYLTVTTPAERPLPGPSRNTPAAPAPAAGPRERPLAAMTADAYRIPRNAHGDPLEEPEVRAAEDGSLTVRTTSNVTGGATRTEPLRHLYRVVSEEDYQRMMRTGHMDTAGEGNTARHGPDREGMVASLFAGNIVELYAPHDDGATARLLKIEVRPGDGWRKHHLDGDTQADTLKPVPTDRITEVSEPFTRDHITENADGETGFVRGSGYHPDDPAPGAPQAPAAPAPGPARRGRPPLIAARRQDVAALGLDGHADADVRAGVAALRNNDPLSAAEASAVAAAVRDALARKAPGAKASLGLTAARLEQLAGSLRAHDDASGRGPEYVPATHVTAGQHVFVPEFPGHPYTAGTVTAVRMTLGGQVAELTITDDSTGEPVTRVVLGDTPIRAVPESPAGRKPARHKPAPPRPAPAPGPAHPGAPQQITAGDVVAGIHVLAGRHQGEVTAVKTGPGGVSFTIAPHDGGPPVTIPAAGRKERIWQLPPPKDTPDLTAGPARVTPSQLRPGDTIRMTTPGTGEIRVRVVAEIGPAAGGYFMKVLDPGTGAESTHSIGELNVYELAARPADPAAAIAATREAAAHSTAQKQVVETLERADGDTVADLASAFAAFVQARPAAAPPLTGEDISQFLRDRATASATLYDRQAELYALAAGQKAGAGPLAAQDVATLTATMRSVQQAAVTRVVRAVETAPDAGTATAIVLALKDPGSEHFRDAARRGDLTPAGRTLYTVLRRAGASDAAGEGTVVSAVPRLPATTTGTAADQIGRIKTALGNPDRLGRIKVRREALPALTVEELAAGHVPPPTTRELYVLDNAADGGPGAHTLAQLELVREAGRILDEDVQARLSARSAAGLTPAERLDQAVKAQIATQDAAYKARAERGAAVAQAEAAARAQLGYPTAADYEAALADVRARAVSRGATPAERAAAEKQLRAMRDAVDSAGDAARRDHRKRIADAEAASTAATAAVEAASPANALREATLAALAELRPMGPPPAGGLTLTAAHGAGDALAAARWAEQHYPSDWLAAARPVPLTVSTDPKRGSYHVGKRQLIVSPRQSQVAAAGQYGEVAVHEIGHHMEQYVPGLLEMERAYQWHRTADAGTDIGNRTRTGTNALRKLKDITNLGYKDKEVTRSDTWPDPYTGREYNDTAWEIFTMGVQGLMAGATDSLDDDYRRWVLGVMATL